jgi:hypothetical protein
VTGLAILVLPACGLVIGVTDLSAPEPASGATDAAKPDHASTEHTTIDPGPPQPEPDAGADAPCSIVQAGLFVPSSATVDDGQGLPWSGFNAGAFQLTDHNYANVSSCCGYAISLTALLTNMKTVVPSSATITGISVEVTAQATEAGDGIFKDNTVHLVTASGPSADRKKDDPYTVGDNPPVRTYGGPLDTWGLALTPDIVNADSFGVAYAIHVAAANGSAIRVDQIGLRVHYCP